MELVIWFVGQMVIVSSKTRGLVKKRLFFNSQNYDKRNCNFTWDILLAKILGAENRSGASPLRTVIATGCIVQL
jgi:hypothetical protein